MALDDNAHYCMNLVRGADRDLYRACLLLPRDVRLPGMALAALYVELDGIAKRAGDPMAGMVRLRWWQDGVASVFSMVEPEGNQPFMVRVGDSPVLAAMAATLGSHKNLEPRVGELLTAFMPDQDPDAAGGLDDLDAHSVATLGSLMTSFQDLLAGQCCTDGAVLASRHVAVAWGHVKAMHAICRSPEMVGQIMGEQDGGCETALTTLCRRARDALDQARGMRGDLARRARRGLLIAVLLDGYIRQIERARYRAARIDPPSSLGLFRAIVAAQTGRY